MKVVKKIEAIVNGSHQSITIGRGLVGEVHIATDDVVIIYIDNNPFKLVAQVRPSFTGLKIEIEVDESCGLTTADYDERSLAALKSDLEEALLSDTCCF